MEINEVKQQIINKQLDNWYIFYGEENGVIRVYLDKMAEVGKYQIVFADSIIDVLGKPKSKAFITLPKLYVIIDDKDFQTNEKAWDAIDRAIKGDIVVFWYTSVDARLKFWKKFKVRAVEFKRLDDRILRRHIKMKMPLSDKACDELIDATEGNWGRIQLELDKVMCYDEAHLTENKEDDVLYRLLDDKTIQSNPHDAIFDFVEAVLRRDVDLAYKLLEESYECGEANLTLISVLYNNFRNLLAYQTDLKNCGLNGWEKRNVAFALDNYSNGELIHALKVLRKCEYGIKTGRIADEISVHYFLVNVI